jgi:hypothetical protein
MYLVVIQKGPYLILNKKPYFFLLIMPFSDAGNVAILDKWLLEISYAFRILCT